MWVARDKSGRLRLFTCYKPWLDNDCEEPWTKWMTDENPITTECEIDENLFPDLTYEDEPIEVKLVKDEYDYMELWNRCMHMFVTYSILRCDKSEPYMLFHIRDKEYWFGENCIYEKFTDCHDREECVKEFIGYIKKYKDICDDFAIGYQTFGTETMIKR